MQMQTINRAHSKHCLRAPPRDLRKERKIPQNFSLGYETLNVSKMYQRTRGCHSSWILSTGQPCSAAELRPVLCICPEASGESCEPKSMFLQMPWDSKKEKCYFSGHVAHSASLFNPAAVCFQKAVEMVPAMATSWKEKLRSGGK